MALPIFWTQKGLEDTHLPPQFQGAISMRGPDPNQMFFRLLQVKCRKRLNGASLGFPNSRVNLFNLWFYSQRKTFHLNVLMVSILQAEALQFCLSSGNSRKGKKKQHTWNKCQKLTFAFLFITIYFADEIAVAEMFLSSPKMMQERCLLGVSELLEATFSIKNSCTGLTERAKPWGVANRSHCAFEQPAAALTCLVHVQPKQLTD